MTAQRIDRAPRSLLRLRRLVVLVLIAAAGAAVAIVGFGLLVSAPWHTKVGPVPPDLRAEAVTIASPSGATLSAWFVPGPPGGGAVVLMHGIYANRLAMLPRARFLNAAGFSVLLFDFQAHGESTGGRITFGHLEALDARAAVAYVRQRLPAERVGALGSSLGGAAALLGPGALPVDALILESVYPEIGAATSNRIRAALGPFLGPVGAAVAQPGAWLLQVMLPPFLGVRPSDLRPIDRLGELTSPVLVASGTRDERTTMTETNAMFERIRAPKMLWPVEGAGHVDLAAYAGDEYRRRVIAFFTQALQQ
jgi:uncharacterized protein